MTDRIKCTRCGAESHVDVADMYLEKLIVIGRLQAQVADLGLSLLDMIEYAQEFSEYIHGDGHPYKLTWLAQMDEDIAKAKALVKVEK